MTKTTRIIVVVPWFGEFAGGAEVLAKSLALEFNRRGIETLVFTTCCKSPYSDWWTNDYEEGAYDVYGLKTFRFSVNDAKKQYQEALGTFIHDKKNMTEEMYNNFFTAGINSDTLVESLAKYIDDGYEVIAMPYYQGLTHSVVNRYPEKVSITPCFHDEDPFYWKPIEILLQNAKYIFYNAYEEKVLTIKHYGQIIGKKIVEASVPGVGIEMLSILKIEQTTLDIPKHYFMYMGRKEEGKNVPLLIEWFSSYIEQTKKDVKLVFIGGGDASLIPKSDIFIDYGYVNESDKKYLLENALSLINLSENESFSIVIMEAWLQKVPVVVHGNCEVTKGHAIRANAGLFPKNQEEFTLCLEYLFENKDNSSTMGKNGFKYANENYTHDIVLEKYFKILEVK